MIMDHETILELYHKSQEEGDPVEQIKSLARLNNCSTGEIRKILTDNGAFVPRQKPVPRPKAAVINKTCEESIPKIAEAIAEAITPTEEKPEEAAGNQKQGCVIVKQLEHVDCEELQKLMNDHNAIISAEAAGPQKLPLPDAVKECLMRGLDDMDGEIHRKTEELRILGEELKVLEAKYSTAVKFIETI